MQRRTLHFVRPMVRPSSVGSGAVPFSSRPPACVTGSGTERVASKTCCRRCPGVSPRACASRAKDGCIPRAVPYGSGRMDVVMSVLNKGRTRKQGAIPLGGQSGIGVRVGCSRVHRQGRGTYTNSFWHTFRGSTSSWSFYPTNLSIAWSTPGPRTAPGGLRPLVSRALDPARLGPASCDLPLV